MYVIRIMTKQFSFNYFGPDSIQMDKNPGIGSATMYVRDMSNDKPTPF
jgi:hypothetical protein